ncbi:MAG: T9SS type A sorting domain-containing protein [Bacteroidota bacterium]
MVYEKPESGWSDIGPIKSITLPEPQQGKESSLSANGDIIAVSSWDDREDLNIISIYDIKEDTWSVIRQDTTFLDFKTDNTEKALKYSIKVSEENLVIGRPSWSGESYFAGSTLIYTLNGPSSPFNLVASQSDESRINLSWNSSSIYATHYEILRSENDNSAYEMIASISSDTTQYFDTDILPGTTYFYKIRSIEGDRKSAFSNEVELTIELVTGLSFAQNEAMLTRIYPNPSINNELNIEIDDPFIGEIHYTVFDLLGHVLERDRFTKTTPNYKQQVDLSGIPNGTYIISIEYGTASFREVIIHR